jgi:hypothetical protein
MYTNFLGTTIRVGICSPTRLSPRFRKLATHGICRGRTVTLGPIPSAARSRDLPRRDLILEVIWIEAVEPAFGRFGLRMNQPTGGPFDPGRETLGAKLYAIRFISGDPNGRVRAFRSVQES